MLYYKYSDYLKNKYGEKVYKLPVNLPVTCPNRLDGDGCAFCAGAGTGFEAMAATVSVTEQLTRTRQMITRKYHANKYIAYFQNYTNTFLPPDRFRSYLMEATRIPGVVEISVSTRPDCVSAEYLDIMRDIRAMTGIQMNVELGLQTANYHTLQMIDRGHGLAEFIDDIFYFVALQMTNHLPVNILRHYVIFFIQFLHFIFTKITATVSIRFFQHFYRFGLADSNQCYILPFSAGAFACSAYTCFHIF